MKYKCFEKKTKTPLFFLQSGFEIIHHRDLPQSLTESPLPPGWEGKKYLFLFIE
jgi:hypothetical protein